MIGLVRISCPDRVFRLCPLDDIPQPILAGHDQVVSFESRSDGEPLGNQRTDAESAVAEKAKHALEVAPLGLARILGGIIDAVTLVVDVVATRSAPFDVTVSTYDFPDETLAADTSYAIEVESVKASSSVALYSAGVETSKRVY